MFFIFLGLEINRENVEVENAVGRNEKLKFLIFQNLL